MAIETTARRGSPGVRAYVHPELAAALTPLLRFLAPLLRAEMARTAEDEQGAGEWLDQARSPLGRRAHCRACRTGAVKGARLVNRRWLARRADLDAFIHEHGRGPGAPSREPANDTREDENEPDDAPSDAEIEAELRSVGHTRAPRRAGRAGR